MSISKHTVDTTTQARLTLFQYGGSLENRARFILEVVKAIKAKLPTDKFIIATKFNCQDCKLRIEL